MSNVNFTQLPSVSNAELTDVIAAVQGSTTVKETLSQILSLVQSNISLNYAGNPNTNVAGVLYQFCYDTVNAKEYICTTAGTSGSAVWTLIGAQVVAPVQGGTGVASPTAGTLPIAAGSSAMTFQALTNGQLLIGSTSAVPVAAGITAGANISVSNGAGSITVSATGPASFAWQEVTGTTQAMQINTGYVPNNVGLVTLTLPAVAPFGSIVRVVGEGAGGWQIAQNANGYIKVGSSTSTVGVGGYIASTAAIDAVNLVCIDSNNGWTLENAPLGSITVV